MDRFEDMQLLIAMESESDEITIPKEIGDISSRYISQWERKVGGSAARQIYAQFTKSAYYRKINELRRRMLTEFRGKRSKEWVYEDSDQVYQDWADEIGRSVVMLTVNDVDALEDYNKGIRRILRESEIFQIAAKYETAVKQIHPKARIKIMAEKDLYKPDYFCVFIVFDIGWVMNEFNVKSLSRDVYVSAAKAVLEFFKSSVIPKMPKEAASYVSTGNIYESDDRIVPIEFDIYAAEQSDEYEMARDAFKKYLNDKSVMEKARKIVKSKSSNLDVTWDGDEQLWLYIYLK